MARKKRVNNRIRARHIAVTETYLKGATYAQAAKEHGYATEAGARWAINRELERRRESNDVRRDKIGEQLHGLARSYIEAAHGGNAAAAHVFLTALRDLSRLYGLNREAPGGVSEVEFGRRMAQIAEVLGPEGMARVIRDAPGVPRELVAACTTPEPGPRVEPGQEGWADDGWSNVGDGDDQGGPEVSYSFDDGLIDTTIRPDPVRVPVVERAARAVGWRPEYQPVADAEVVDVVEVDPDDQDDDGGCGCGGQGNPLPPSMRRVKVDVLAERGQPRLDSTLGGARQRRVHPWVAAGYDPLAHAFGGQQIMRGEDILPPIPPTRG